jgi:hypothetical protein
VISRSPVPPALADVAHVRRRVVTCRSRLYVDDG